MGPSKDWISKLTEIHSILERKGFADVSEEILKEQVAGATGGEIFLLVVDKLISIKDERPEVYALIREETEWMIKYGKTMGYLP